MATAVSAAMPQMSDVNPTIVLDAFHGNLSEELKVKT
jgi:hypothetical protein